MSEGEEYREQVIKGKSLTGTSAVSVLHSQLDGGGELVCGYVSRVLRLVAEDPAVRGGREGDAAGGRSSSPRRMPHSSICPPSPRHAPLVDCPPPL